MTDALHRPLSAEIAEKASRTAQEPVEAPVKRELPSREFLENSLKCLGSDPDTVAQTLRDLGIAGDHRANSCPISRFMTGHAGVLHTSSCSANSWVTLGLGLAEWFVLIHPGPVREFVRRFDTNQYPDLESRRGI